jgi:hypothetical protein
MGLTDFQRKTLLSTYEQFLDSAGDRLNFTHELEDIERKHNRETKKKRRDVSPPPRKRREVSPLYPNKEDGEIFMAFRGHLIFPEKMDENQIIDWLYKVGCQTGAIRIEIHKSTQLRANVFFEKRDDYLRFIDSNGIDGFKTQEYIVRR